MLSDKDLLSLYKDGQKMLMNPLEMGPDGLTKVLTKHIPIDTLGVVQVSFDSRQQIIQSEFLHRYNCDEWLNVYFENNFHKIDPVLKFCPHRANEVLQWKDFPESKSKESKLLFEASLDYGLNNGYAIAVPYGMGTYFLISVNAEEKHDVEKVSSVLRNISMYVPPFFRTLKQSHNLEKLNLTDREMNVLYYLKENKKKDELADILKLSPSTVRHHMRSVFNKFEVESHQELLYKLGDLGLI